MPNEIQIRQFQSSDQDALLDFLRIAYSDDPRKSQFDHWKWISLENPRVAENEVPLWIATSGGQVVGQAATIPVELSVGGETMRAIWLIDFIVHGDYRGQGLGKRLVLAAQKHCGAIMTLGFNEQSGAVFRSLNWVSLGGIHRYQKLLFAGNTLKGIGSRGPIRGAANLISVPLRRNLTRTRPAENQTLRMVTQFDTCFDDLWRRASVQWLCAVKRDARGLEWQFLRQPGKKFDVIGLYEKEQLLGYAVLFFREAGPGGAPPKAAISDFCYDSTGGEELIDQLLEAALDLAVQRRAGSLVIDILEPNVERRLQSYGFCRVKKSPRFMACVTQRQDLIYKPNNWFLSRGDCDISIFEPPNLTGEERSRG